MKAIPFLFFIFKFLQYSRKVAETAQQIFITNDKVNVAGLVIAGSADFKTDLCQSDMFDARLRAKISAGRPIVGGGAGTGISAKMSEAGGIDLLVIYNSGRFRMAGRGSLSGMMPYGDANAIVLDMAPPVAAFGKVRDGRGAHAASSSFSLSTSAFSRRSWMRHNGLTSQ